MDNEGVGIGYTLATGRLFCEVRELHKFAEGLMDRPIFTHEFADEEFWNRMREKFEKEVLSG